jgi:type II secretion system protein D
LVPDARTNRILIIARPDSIKYLKKLILQFDQAANVMEPLEYPLRYAKASEVLPALQNLLAENKDQGAGGANPSVSNPNNARPASSIGDSGSGGSGSKGASSRLQAPTDDTAPESVIVGKTKLIADKKANSILVLGPPEAKERVKMMLTLLDKRPQQVHLATVIGQLTLGDGSEFGVDLLKKFGKIDSGGLAAGQRTRTAAGETVPEPSSLVTSTLIPLISGMTIYGAIGSQLDIYVKALESSNRFKVLSRPSVYTANNKKATITSGTQVPVPTSTISSLNTGTTDNTALNSTIEFKDVLLKLEVVPQINAEKEVSLNIYQSNDSVNGSTSISGNSVPIISTQELETTITVRNRQTVVLGGLVTDGKEQLVSGTPWISRIPLLGMLFKDTRKTNNRTELIVLIEPTVIETQEEEQILKKQESNRLVVGADSENYAKPPIKPPVDQTKRLFFMPRNEKAVP